MTAAAFSLAELRAAFTALQAGDFTQPVWGVSDDDGAVRRVAQPSALGVVGVSAGIGTTTVALAVAEAIGAARLVEFSTPHASGLAGASTAELGIRNGWSLGVRHGLRIERRVAAAATLLDADDGAASVVDFGSWTGHVPRSVALVLVSGCSVPGIRRLNACLVEACPSARRVVPVITGCPGRSVPKQAIGAFGPELRDVYVAKRALIVPECPPLRVAGITPEPLPRALRVAVEPISDLLEEIS